MFQYVHFLSVFLTRVFQFEHSKVDYNNNIALYDFKGNAPNTVILIMIQ